MSDTLQGLHGSEEGDALEVIVSLSHKGEVEGIAKKAFAPKEVHITGAGGQLYNRHVITFIIDTCRHRQ